MVKVKCGAIIKEVSKGALKWYKIAGWKILEDKNWNYIEKMQI